MEKKFVKRKARIEEEEQQKQLGLTEEERRALRGSKFAPLPSSQSSTSRPRLAHPGGPLTTNKATALAKFLQRKLKQPDGLSSIDPILLQLAVNNTKDNLRASVARDGTSSSGAIVRHVDCFDNSSKDYCEKEEDNHKNAERKNLKKHKEKKKKKKKDSSEEEEDNHKNAERTDLKKHKKEKKKKRKKDSSRGRQQRNCRKKETEKA